MISIFRIHLQCLDSRQDDLFTARYQLFFNEVWYEARHRQRWDVWYHGASDSECNVWKKPWVRLPEIIIHIQTTQSLRNLLTRWWLKFQKNPWHLIRPESLGHCVKRIFRKSLVETLRGQVEAISTNCATRIISCNGSWCRCSHIGNVAQEIINNSCTLKRWKKHEGI